VFFLKTIFFSFLFSIYPRRYIKASIKPRFYLGVSVRNPEIWLVIYYTNTCEQKSSISNTYEVKPEKV
jgi:hypothetical protein